MTSGTFGGSNISIGTVSNYTGGYTEPNQYTIKLNKIYKNVISVALKSSEFPNSEFVVKTQPTNYANNKIYWQNYSEGDYTYSIDITAGRYNPTELINEIEEKFYDTKRVNYALIEYFQSVPDDPQYQNYTNHNYIKVEIGTDTDTTKFSSYKETILNRPFYNLYYINSIFVPVPASGDLPDPPDHLYPLFIVVNYPYHGLTMNTTYATGTAPFIPNDTTGDTIIINNSITFMGVPASFIDGTYEVFQVPTSLSLLSRDYFMIKLVPLDIGNYPTRLATLGGGVIKIYTPNIFRLLFDKNDTIGRMLGFSNVGTTLAVTKFDSEITNKDVYQPDIYPDIVVDTTTPGNAIMMSGYNYIIMQCDQFPVMEMMGKVKSGFAKILFVGIPGKMMYNTFVNTPKIYYEPIKELSELSFKFYSPDGELYDFNGLDHSFTLEIITLDELPYDSNINTQTGVRI
jgi:hypothetical protein